MATATYEPIATTTLGASASSITFSSIPATYTDLRVVYVLRTNRANATDGGYITYNNDSATNYSETVLYGDGTTAVTSSSPNLTAIDIVSAVGNSATSGIFGLHTVDIFSYAGSTNKTCLITTQTDKNGAANSIVARVVGLWRSTSAITSIKIVPSTGPNWLTGSTATLYGILKA